MIYYNTRIYSNAVETLNVNPINYNETKNINRVYKNRKKNTIRAHVYKHTVGNET